MIIDAHQHFWQRSQPFNYRWLDAPEMSAIRRDFLPEHLAPLLAEVGVERSIFVQTQHDLAENRWALSLAEKNPFLAGVVGWVDLASPDCERQLLEFKDHPKFVGIRHVTQAEPDDDFIVREDVLRGLKMLEKHRVPFDLLFFTQHLRHASTLARTFPDLRFVIDHLSKPKIKDRIVAGWKEDLRAAAKYPNVHCKLSGMITEADWKSWKPADLRPYVREALDAFGPSRCMFGSDWPVCELAGSYRQVFEALRDCLGDLSPEDAADIFGGVAAKFYGLGINAT